MKKIFYFSVLISAAFLAQIAPADAQLPSSPLNEEYALTGAESVGNTWGGTYEIGAAGVLNISGGGMLTVTYGQNQWGTFNNNGVVNIGTDDSAGTLIMNSPASFSPGWASFFYSPGELNIGKAGSLTFTGYLPSYWGVSVNIKNLDLAGTVSVLPDGGVDSYFRVDNLTLRESGALQTNGMNLYVENGVWDIYGGGIAATKLRVSAGSATINLRGENLLGNLNAISVDTDKGVNLKMNVEADNTVKNLEFHSNTSIELSVAEGSRLLINNFTTKDNGGVWQAQNAEIIFRDWSGGSFFIGNSDYWIEDNRLYIPAADTYVDLIAYDADGGLLSGVWSFEWNADLNLNELTLTVPEPEALAAIIGAIALAVCAIRRRR